MAGSRHPPLVPCLPLAAYARLAQRVFEPGRRLGGQGFDASQSFACEIDDAGSRFFSGRRSAEPLTEGQPGP